MKLHSLTTPSSNRRNIPGFEVVCSNRQTSSIATRQPPTLSNLAPCVLTPARTCAHVIGPGGTIVWLSLRRQPHLSHPFPFPSGRADHAREPLYPEAPWARPLCQSSAMRSSFSERVHWPLPRALFDTKIPPCSAPRHAFYRGSVVGPRGAPRKKGVVDMLRIG
jgi:hypothetical protein